MSRSKRTERSRENVFAWRSVESRLIRSRNLRNLTMLSRLSVVCVREADLEL